MEESRAENRARAAFSLLLRRTYTQHLLHIARAESQHGWVGLTCQHAQWKRNTVVLSLWAAALQRLA